MSGPGVPEGWVLGVFGGPGARVLGVPGAPKGWILVVFGVSSAEGWILGVLPPED